MKKKKKLENILHHLFLELMPSQVWMWFALPNCNFFYNSSFTKGTKDTFTHLAKFLCHLKEIKTFSENLQLFKRGKRTMTPCHGLFLKFHNSHCNVTYDKSLILLFVDKYLKDMTQHEKIHYFYVQYPPAPPAITSWFDCGSFHTVLTSAEMIDLNMFYFLFTNNII